MGWPLAPLALGGPGELPAAMSGGGSISENGEWAIIYQPARRVLAPVAGLEAPGFSEIHYFLIIQRKPLFYIINIIVPCVLISSLVVLVYFLPAQGELGGGWGHTDRKGGCTVGGRGKGIGRPWAASLLSPTRFLPGSRWPEVHGQHLGPAGPDGLPLPDCPEGAHDVTQRPPHWQVSGCQPAWWGDPGKRPGPPAAFLLPPPGTCSL